MIPQAIRMAENAFRRYKTRDPYEIIDARNIKLRFFDEPKGLLGFYTVLNRKQIIGLNNSDANIKEVYGGEVGLLNLIRGYSCLLEDLQAFKEREED